MEKIVEKHPVNMDMNTYNLNMNNTNANTNIATEMFATIKGFRPGLKSLDIDEFGCLEATMRSEKCCRGVVFDLALSRGFEDIDAKWNRGSSLFVVTARCKGQA